MKSGVLDVLDTQIGHQLLRLLGTKVANKKTVANRTLDDFHFCPPKNCPRSYFHLVQQLRHPIVLHFPSCAIHLGDKDLATTYRADHGRLATPGMLQKVLSQIEDDVAETAQTHDGTERLALGEMQSLLRESFTKWQWCTWNMICRREKNTFHSTKSKTSIHLKLSIDISPHLHQALVKTKQSWDPSTLYNSSLPRHPTHSGVVPLSLGVSSAPPNSQCKSDDLPTQSLEPSQGLDPKKIIFP